MRIDDAIDRLVAARAIYGLEPSGPPDDLSVLEEVERAIAPMTVPDDLRRFWERIDSRTFGVAHGARFRTPDVGLWSWREDRWASTDYGQPVDPPNLFQIGYESHRCLSVELDGPFGTGGSVWDWNVTGDDLVKVYDDLASYVASTALLVAAGNLAEYEVGDAHIWVDEELEGNPFRVAETRHLQAGIGPRRFEPATWPERWNEMDALSWTGSWGHGATHTIEGLRIAGARTPTRGRIHGEVSSIDETWVHLRDDSSTMRFDAEERWWAGASVGGRFEIDLTFSPGEGDPGPHNVRPIS